MADGSITFSTDLDNKELEKQLQSLKKKINSTEDKISQKQAEKLPLVNQAKELGAELDAAKAKLYEMQNAATGAFSADEIKEQKLHVSGLQSEWNGVQSRVERYDTAIDNATIELDRSKEKAGAISKELAEAGYNADAMDKATKKAHTSMGRFALRVREVVRSALVFTLITQALAKFREWVGKVIKTNTEASAAVARLKGALLTLAQPLVNVIIPAFTAFVNTLANFVNFIASIFSAISGVTAEESASAAENLYDETNALNGVGSAAKKAEKSLAGFDEINKLASESATSSGGGSGDIMPDFSSLKELPAALKNLAADIAVKIQELKFAWDDGTIAENKDAWIIALSGMLGAVIGSMFGGLTGTVIGLLLGLSVGFISCVFLDKTSNPDEYKKIFIVVLGAILGAILGTMFGGVTGGVIGLLLGATVSIITLEFIKGDASSWDTQKTIIVVLSAILGAILGAAFGGLVGGVIGFLLGALISFISIEFNKGGFNEDLAIASLRVALFAIFGLILGTMFGGLVGGVLGFLMGMTVGFTSVAFDKELSGKVQSAAQKALKIALTTIVGALIGAVFGGGVFGGIIGGVIGLTFGLAITLGDATISDKTGTSSSLGGTANHSSGAGRSAVSISSASLYSAASSVPALATGAVIPPNREFMAILGDQKSGTNIEAPLDTIVQAVMLALQKSGTSNSGGGQVIENILNLDGETIYRNQKKVSRRHGTSLVGV